MKTAILSVGTEILFGQITNTNTVYLSQQLNLLGFDVMCHYTVGDNEKRLEDLIKNTLKECDLIIITGGLGPTEDDLTKETVCKALHDTLIEDPVSMETLKASFKKYNMVMNPNNLKQAYMPSRADVFDNDSGTAPGFCLEENGKRVICMPGPPREMTRMFQRRVKPFLEKLQDSTIYYRTIRLFGIGESSLETSLLELIDAQTDPTIATYAKEGECQLRIASKRKNENEAKYAVDEMIHKVESKVGDYIYSLDDEELHEVVGKKLINKNISISSAESCTGGMFAEYLTSVSGISKVFDRGLVTYTYRAKEEELDVSKETLEKYTAFSEEVAREMVMGLAKKTGSRLCISVTGIAGPDGGTEDKPVGLIYIGYSFDQNIGVKELHIRNVNRNWNRRYAVLSMLDIVNKLIDNIEV